MINWPVACPTLKSQSKRSGSLTLRPLQESDVDPIFQACQDPMIPAFTRVPSPYDREMAVDFVRESAFAYLNRLALSFAIEVDGEFVGTIGLHTLRLSDHCAEVGYWIAGAYRGKGICTEALIVLTDFSLDVMQFRRLEALADIDNLPSQRVMERAGYSREGILQARTTRPDGRQIDMALFSKVMSEGK
jgi:RimJ/RimL family protein N-acetyltransferase